MKYASVLGILTLLLVSGCSSVLITPKPNTPGAIVNPSDQSIKINKSDLAISARVQNTAVGGYEIDTALASFYLTIQNRTGSPISPTLANFVLKDSKGTIHHPVSPEDVNAILNPQIAYFMPYPFVGYYDMVDREQYRSTAAMASERAYIGSGLPAVELLTPLPTGTIKSGQGISGMLYFKIELIDETFVELKASFPVGATGRERLFSFPFSIEK